MIRSLTLAGLCLHLALFVGCSGGGVGGKPPELVPITGTVTLDGAPLAGAAVNFIPVVGPASAAMTDEGGHYELINRSGGKGAVISEHFVEITMDIAGSGVEKLPEKYNKKTTLAASVRGGDGPINFDLKSK